MDGPLCPDRQRKKDSMDGCMQRVLVNSSLSTWRPVMSGVSDVLGVSIGADTVPHLYWQHGQCDQGHPQ